jgi:capsid protein
LLRLSNARLHTKSFHRSAKPGVTAYRFRKRLFSETLRLEIPYELLVKHFTVSYSARRAALLEARKSFRMRRTWLASDFCQPIYEEWFAEAVAKGRIDIQVSLNPLIRKAYTQAEWYGPAPGQIDPLKKR